MAPVSEKILKSGSLRMHFSILEQKLEWLNRTQTSLNFVFFFYSVTAHEYPKESGSKLREIAGEFRQPPALIENPG